MKKALTLAIMAILGACNAAPSSSTTDSTHSAMDSSAMVKPIQSPYEIMYSSKFVIDDPKNAESLLAIWKSYDNANVKSTRDLFADTIEALLGDGTFIRGSRDTVLAGIQAFRNSFSNAVDQVTAVMAVKSTDKNEHWALIWGTETDTYKNGKIDSVGLQETWRFNQEGKAEFLLQYRKALVPPKKMK